MKRTLATSTALILTVALSAAAPALALEPAGPDSLEAAVLDFERLYYEILGDAGSEPRIESHGDGLHSITLPISPVQREQLARARVAKKIQVLAVGHSLSTPGSTRSLISTVLSFLSIKYNYWFVVVNLTGDDQIVETKRKLKGPGLKFNRTADLEYPANTIKVFWDETEEGLGKDGVYTHQVKGSKAGGAKMRFFGQ